MISIMEDKRVSCERKCIRSCEKYYTADDLANAFNAGYKKGQRAGLTEGREEGYRIGYEKGAVEGCKNTKQKALDCIKCIECLKCSD